MTLLGSEGGLVHGGRAHTPALTRGLVGQAVRLSFYLSAGLKLQGLKPHRGAVSPMQTALHTMHLGL